MATTQTENPLKNTIFLLFVVASFISNVGTWLFNVGAGWLMTELGSTAFSVSLVQTATLGPMLLLGLLAGAMGDLFDRRRIILFSQAFLVVNTLVFAYLVYLEAATVGWLLFFTLLNGVGAAFARPVMSAIIPQMVGRKALRLAMSANSISFNLSRAVGPIMGGWLITTYSIDWPFWVDGVSFAAVILVVYFWRNDQKASAALQKPTAGNVKLAIGDSLRFLRYTPALNNSIIRSVVFFFSAGALWALLPLVAKEKLGGGADLYGFLLGAAGFAAVIAGFFVNRITEWVGANRVVVGASIGLGAGLAALGLATSPPLALAGSAIAGFCWQLSFTNLITSSQYALPKWFGARGMSYFIMAMSGSLAIGSALWGFLADLTSLDVAHYLAAGLAVICVPLGSRFPLDQAKDADLRAISEDDEPLYSVVSDPRPEGGWMRIRIHYQIGNADREEVIRRLRQLKPKRYRAGGLYWGVFQTEEKSKLIESFLELSWGTKVAQITHMTREDRNSIEAFHRWLEEQGGEFSREVIFEVH
jgi:MFS family permease